MASLAKPATLPTLLLGSRLQIPTYLLRLSKVLRMIGRSLNATACRFQSPMFRRIYGPPFGDHQVFSRMQQAGLNSSTSTCTESLLYNGSYATCIANALSID